MKASSYICECLTFRKEHKSLPCKVRIVTFNEVTQALSNIFDELDAFEGFPSTLEAFFSLDRIGCDRRTQSMHRSKGRKVLELEALPVNQDVHLGLEKV
jgi:hypothetical protein